MKNLQILLFLIIINVFIGCGTAHDYTTNNLNKSYFSEKTIFIKLNPSSKKQVFLNGMTGGQSVTQPDVKETFKQALNEISTETNVNCKFVENFEGLINDKNSLLFEAHILEIDYNMGFSTFTMKTVVDFKKTIDNKEIRATGIRKSGGGKTVDNLRKSLKDVTFNFLKELNKQ